MKNLSKLFMAAVFVMVVSICGCGGGSMETPTSSAVQSGSAKEGVVGIRIDFQTQTQTQSQAVNADGAVAKAVASGDFNKIDFLKKGVTHVTVDIYGLDIASGYYIYFMSQDIPVINGVADSKDTLILSKGKYYLYLSCNNVRDDCYFFGSSEITVVAGHNEVVIDLTVNYSLPVNFSITNMVGNFDKTASYVVDSVALNAIVDDILGSTDTGAYIDGDGTLHFGGFIQLENPSTKFWYSIKDNNGVTYAQSLDIDIATALQSRVDFGELKFPYVAGGEIDITVIFPK